MQTLPVRQKSTCLTVDKLPFLTITPPLKTCQVCVVVPVKNEAENLPALLESLTHQTDTAGRPLDRDRYEVLILANNCSDDSVAIAQAWANAYRDLQLHVIPVELFRTQACIGYARRLVMNEAYRRLSMVHSDRTVIASTDGDTVVSPTWLATLLQEFDQGVDMVCGRILTQRRAAEIPNKTSLYFLRYMAHRYLTAQLEALLDPLPHDGWPRHYQHFGANMAILSAVYGQVGGLPEVSTQEDVALHRRLQQIDAKIRHSPTVRVMTSARRIGRTSGGLAERLNQLTVAGQHQQTIMVESPHLTETRILLRHQLRQVWLSPPRGTSTSPSPERSQLGRLARQLGLQESTLSLKLATAPTFGLLCEAIEAQQRHHLMPLFDHYPSVEISVANGYLRQRLQDLRQPQSPLRLSLERAAHRPSSSKPLKQIQPIPLFSLTY